MAYSITTKDGITINNIPDDVPPDAQELKDRVAAIRAGQTEKLAQPTAQATEQPQEGPSTGQQLRRQAGLAARAVPGAIASTLGIVGDPLNALINMITGSKLQTISGATENLLTRAGLPEPQSTSEKIVYDINRAALGAAGPGAAIRAVTPQAPVRVAPQARMEPTFVPPVSPVSPAGVAQQALVENLGLQTTGAVGGTLAAQLAAQAGAGPVGQIAAGLGGGILAPGAAQTIAGRATTGGREAVRPFTEAGREVIAGNVLRQLASSPETAIARAREYQAPLGGYTPTTAQATRDIGLISAETAIRGLDTTGKFATQASQANQVRSGILNALAKDKDALDAAILQRDNVTGPLRQNAFDQAAVSPETLQSAVTLTVSKNIDDILKSSAGARKPVQDAMAFAKSRLAEGTTPERLYEVRKDLRDAAQGLLDSEKGAYRLASGQLESVIRSIDDVLETSAPGYKNYLDTYRNLSQKIDALKAAQEFRGKVLTTTPDPGNVSDYLISQPAFTRAIRAVEKDPNTKLTQTQISILRKVGKDLDEGVLARGAKVPGSDTFKNLSTANLIGGIVGKQLFGELTPALQSKINPFNWMYSGSDEAIKEVLVDAMLDPKLASRLMAKASTTKVEPISKELQRRAINLGYGSIFGLTE